MRRVFDLWRRAGPVAHASTPDAELLDRFARHGDQTAFAALMDRHGPLVYGACRRLLHNPLDAEDAFQAAFLVLVRRAHSIIGQPLGPWLHRVAVLTARNLRRRNATRAGTPATAAEPTCPPTTAAVDARLDLDAALSTLPAKYRVPLVLCHLQGWTRRELAAHLGCPESTASSLLGRGLARLRKRLAGRDPAVALAVAGSVTVPAELSASAVRAAVLFRTGSLAATAPVVADLTNGVLHMFRVKKAATAAVVAVALAVLGIGLTGGTDPRAVAQPPQPAANPTRPNDDPKPRPDDVDREIEVLRLKLKALEDEQAKQRALRADQEALKKLAKRLEKQAKEATPTEPYILVAVRDSGGLGPDIVVTEYGPGGKQAIGSLGCSGIDILKVYLARTRKDPDGPKKLVVRIDPTCPAAKAKVVLNICQQAGFETTAVLDWQDEPADFRVRPKNSKLSPYVIEPPDVLLIQVVVRTNGKVCSLPLQPVSGSFTVRPDGTVGLGVYGSVDVNGRTIDEATEAIRKHIAARSQALGSAIPSESLVVVVDVLAFNSKRYYVIIAGPDGEQVFPFPCTGHETVLDAIAGVNGLSVRVADAEVWIARRATEPSEPWQTLPVDWIGITQHGKTATNYQLLPGDRVYVKSRK